MDENNQLGSLQEITHDSFTKYPLQAPFAIKEYLRNLNDDDEEDEDTEVLGDENYDKPDTVSWLHVEPEDSEECATLKIKLHNLKYFNTFKTAITHTSLIVFLASVKTTSYVSINFDKYMQQYQADTKNDDLDIYNMRLFYLQSLTAQKMGIGRKIKNVVEVDGQVDIEYEEDNEDSETVLAEVLRAQKEYDGLITKIVDLYKQRKVYLTME